LHYSHYNHVLPLDYSIQLGIVRNNEFLLNPSSYTIIHKLVGGVLASIVQSHNPNLPTCIVFHKSFEFLKHVEDPILSLYEVYLGLLGVVIYEKNKILGTTLM
jgi:hypothetical protein